MKSAAASFTPIVSNEKKVDVSIDGDQAVIRLSTWCEDLGWCGQKTMSLDASMLDELHRVIAAARVRLKLASDDEPQPTRVIEFPVAA